MLIPYTAAAGPGGVKENQYNEKEPLTCLVAPTGIYTIFLNMYLAWVSICLWAAQISTNSALYNHKTKEEYSGPFTECPAR